jgi:CDP-diacylglycerol--glycerol-3-phosphate 3-phosphatidyltransferase
VNLANFLTCSRVALAMIFAVFLFLPHPFGKFLALFAFVTAALTDYWDGVVARGMGEESQFGKLMDPIADKMLTLSAFFSFWWLGLLPFWMVLIVVLRDVLVTVARFFMSSGSASRGARSSGKQKTVLQILFIIGVLLYLIACQSPEWHSSWNERSLQIIHGAMLLIVLATVWSGLRVIKK